MVAEEKGKRKKTESGLRRKIRQWSEAFQTWRFYRMAKECKYVLDSMGGAEGPRNDEEYMQIFGQEPPCNYSR